MLDREIIFNTNPLFKDCRWIDLLYNMVRVCNSYEQPSQFQFRRKLIKLCPFSSNKLFGRLVDRYRTHLKYSNGKSNNNSNSSSSSNEEIVEPTVIINTIKFYLIFLSIIIMSSSVPLLLTALVLTALWGAVKKNGAPRSQILYQLKDWKRSRCEQSTLRIKDFEYGPSLSISVQKK